MIQPILAIFGYRHLLEEFISRDIRGRFIGSMAGIFWTVIHPLVNILVYYFIFSMVMRIRVTFEETGTNSFFVFFLSGFFPWLIFSESLSKSVGILIDNANLISKVVFPVELLPAGVVISTFIINGIGMLFFLIYLFVIGYGHIFWLYLPALMLLHFIFIWGICNMLSALCVFIRDIREMLGIFLNVWFYATPVIYPVSMVPDFMRVVIGINPMNMFTELYRGILLTHQISVPAVIVVAIFSAMSYLFGAYIFMRAKPAFGDVL
jgi:lipopolysaccharide transport system permease protein